MQGPRVEQTHQLDPKPAGETGDRARQELQQPGEKVEEQALQDVEQEPVEETEERMHQEEAPQEPTGVRVQPPDEDAMRARAVAAILADPDLGEKDKARAIQKLGYSAAQCWREFGLAKTTSYEVRAELVKPEGKQRDGGRDKDDHTLAPVMKEKDRVLPEWIAGQVQALYDGNERDAKIFMSGMSVPLFGARFVAEAIKPVIALMEVWQRGMVEAARAAQGTGDQIAAKAAREAAAGVAGYFEERRPWEHVSAGTDPFKQMLADIMKPMMQNVVNSLMPGGAAETSLPPGFTRRKATEGE